MKNLILLLLLFVACKKDNNPFLSKTNNPNISIPLVINSNVSDSIAGLFAYHNVEIKSFNTETYKIVTSKLHLAFTDLIKYNNEWFITFRLSDAHVANNFGHIIICKSKDLIKWESEQIFIQKDFDLRDPKFLIKDSTLFIHFHSTTIRPYGESRNDYISQYDFNKKSWNRAILLNKNTSNKSWFWRLTEYNDTIYTISYMTGEPLRIYMSRDAFEFKEIYEFNIDGKPSEVTLRFRNDTAYAIIRREGLHALLGKSTVSNITHWEFETLPWITFGGPNFLINNDNLLITGRVNGQAKLFNHYLTESKQTELFTLKGGINEMGYCGMFIEDKNLFISYYTGTEDGGYSINLSKVNIK